MYPIYFHKPVGAVRSVVATLMLVLGSSAFAVPILGVNDPVNNSAEFTWLGDSIFIENTSNFDARITAFGFDSSTNVLGLDSVSGTEDDTAWTLLFNEAVGGTGGGTFEFGVTTSKGADKNLTGGFPNAGIAVGSTGVFGFDLGLSLVFEDMSNFFVRFQRTGEDGGSDRGVYCSGDCDPVNVPEPRTLAILAVGALGLLIGRRAQNKQ